ncbi:potassium channel family protein [Tsukamurella pulmonis]|uniref:potassium channel family protein n=1 Tax=Tsukamurella pulmonis TaxID=47312 RepID=UPI001EDFF396|nr:potassium channel family protein [Tsukamurella pulmonis]
MTRRQVWERRTNPLMIALALGFLAVYAVQVLDVAPTPLVRCLVDWSDIAIWAAFVADYLIRVRLSTDRWRFVRTHPIDLLAIALPPFRPLRALRAAPLLIGGLHRARLTRARLAVFVGTTSVLVVFLCSLAFLDAERGAPDTKVTGYGDALWWAAVTVTTVGYGDVYPVTTEGRIVALLLMVVGIGLISFVIGTATSWVVDQLKAADARALNTDREVDELTAEVRALRTEIAALRGPAPDARDAAPSPPDGA